MKIVVANAEEVTPTSDAGDESSVTSSFSSVSVIILQRTIWRTDKYPLPITVLRRLDQTDERLDLSRDDPRLVLPKGVDSRESDASPRQLQRKPSHLQNCHFTSCADPDHLDLLRRSPGHYHGRILHRKHWRKYGWGARADRKCRQCVCLMSRHRYCEVERHRD